jgi:hypothetical protein
MVQAGFTLLPTKTSQLWIHMCGGSENFLSTFPQVASMRGVKGLLHLIWVAVILSLVSCLLIKTEVTRNGHPSKPY